MSIKAWCLVLTSFASCSVSALEISSVVHEPKIISFEKEKYVDIKFSIDEEAKIIVNIFDGRDLLVRRINSGKMFSPGEHSVRWDGKDQAGRKVPPEAYRYTIVASNNGKNVEHDLTDLTLGKEIKPGDVKWDPKTKKIKYVLPKPGRVHIRIGIKDHGPYLKGLLDWVPRMAGLQEEGWDGWDRSKVLDLTNHKNLDVTVLAYELSDNTILVGPKQTNVNLISDFKWPQEKRTLKKKAKKRMYAHYQQTMESRGGLDIRLVLPKTSGKTQNGLPIVSGIVPIRMEIDEKDLARALNRGFEPAFFVDGVFTYENEVGFMPITWHWDSTKVNDGVHYITANVRGYEGNFGVATVKVFVQRKKNKSDSN